MLDNRTAEISPLDLTDVKLLSAVLEAANDAIVITEAETDPAPSPRIVYANEAYLQMSGYDLHEVIGQSPRMLQGLGTCRATLDRIRQKLAAWEPFREDVLNYRKDGTPFWVELNVRPLADETGLYTHWVSVQRDVTAQRKAIDDLRQSEERFRLIADSASDVLWDYDFVSGFMWSSADWPSKLGVEVDPAKAQGFHWMEIVDSSDRQRIISAFQRVIKSDASTWGTEFKVRHAEGQIISLAVTASILRHPDGRASRILGTVRNVTYERRTQEGYTRARALEAVGQLTGGVAHDFNNLLMIIVGNVELLQMSNLGEEDAETVSAIAHAAESAAQLTTQLLTFARQAQLNRTRVDVAKLVSETSLLLRAGVSENIRFSQSFAPDLWSVDADTNSLQQALVNLAMNAKDAMPRGGEIVVTCSNLEVDDDMVPATTDLRSGRYVTISVSDTGEGMPPEVLARAFEPFFTTKDIGKGTGLGLSTVYGFAKQSNGGVSIYSEPGRGTTVNLYLPAGEGDAPKDSQSEPVIEAQRPRHAQRVLVVEDQPQVRAHVEKTLVRLGYAVETAPDAATALTMLTEGKSFDLLLTDIIMPGGMNGKELGEAALRLAPQIKILYTSGYPAAAFEHLGLKEQSRINFLSKPYKTSQLQTMLAEILDDQSQG